MNQIPSAVKNKKAAKGQPAAHLPPFRLTGRDLRMLVSIWAYCVATAAQIARRHFQWDAVRANGKLNTKCLHRLMVLFRYGYLHREEQPQRLSEGRRPLVYSVTERGAEAISGLLGRDAEDIAASIPSRRLSPLFLDHTLRAVDFRVAVELATEASDWTLEKWLDERPLKRQQMRDYVTISGPEGGRLRATVVPDGYFVLRSNERVFHQFVEIDVGTVTGAASKWGRRDWARRVAAYLEYYRSGAYHNRYHTQSMRVLTVTTTEKRLANLRAVTERAGGRSRFWFTTFAEAARNDVLRDPVWQVAGRPDRSALVW